MPGWSPPAGRSAGEYRLYDAEAVARLDLVWTLRELGLGLEVIRAVLPRATTVPQVAAAHVAVSGLDYQAVLERAGQALADGDRARFTRGPVRAGPPRPGGRTARGPGPTGDVHRPPRWSATGNCSASCAASRRSRPRCRPSSGSSPRSAPGRNGAPVAIMAG